MGQFAQKAEEILALFLWLGILAEGELQQPVDGLGTRFKAMSEAEFVDLFPQLLFQAQVKH